MLRPYFVFILAVCLQNSFPCSAQTVPSPNWSSDSSVVQAPIIKTGNDQHADSTSPGTNQLTFSDPNLNKLRFDQTTLKKNTKIMGAPDSTESRAMFANLGHTCITMFSTDHYYDSLGCTLHFSSVDKNAKERKKLTMITLDSNSTVRINDSMISRCNMKVITQMFGAGNDSAYYEIDPESYWRYPLVLNGQNVIGEFVFAENGELLRLCITMDRSKS